MGSSNSTTNQSQQSTTAPGAQSAPTVAGLTSALNPLISSSGLTSPQQTAIDQLTATGQAGNPYAAAEGTNATTLLSGGGATSQNPALTQNLSTLQSTLSPYTDPNYSTVNSPAVQQAIQQANIGISNGVNGQFAAAGRTGSGMNTQTLAQGEEAADAPIILNQANQDTATRLGAANTLYGAGNTTSGAITGNNQTALANEQNGSTAATSALNAENWGPNAVLGAQNLQQSIPAQNLGLLASIGIPLAGLNTTTSGTGTSNTNASPSALQDITGILGALGSLTGGKTATPSDRRFKTDIAEIGMLFDGTPVYRYRYIGEVGFQIGVMAQDIESETPNAVVENDAGFKFVDYHAATERSAKMAEAA